MYVVNDFLIIFSGLYGVAIGFVKGLFQCNSSAVLHLRPGPARVSQVQFTLLNEQEHVDSESKAYSDNYRRMAVVVFAPT